MGKVFKLFQLLLMSPDTNQGNMVKKSQEKSRKTKEVQREVEKDQQILRSKQVMEVMEVKGKV